MVRHTQGLRPLAGQKGRKNLTEGQTAPTAGLSSHEVRRVG